MRKLLTITALMILLLPLTNQIYARQFYTQMPSGSYTQSCSNCSMDRSSLKCTCADRSGFQRNTFLQDAQYCQSVENNNGQLQCSGSDSESSRPWKFHRRHGRTADIQAGPIWNQADAEQKCPSLCQNNRGQWTGQWNTTVWGQMSVCQCRF